MIKSKNLYENTIFLLLLFITLSCSRSYYTPILKPTPRSSSTLLNKNRQKLIDSLRESLYYHNSYYLLNTNYSLATATHIFFINYDSTAIYTHLEYPDKIGKAIQQPSKYIQTDSIYQFVYPEETWNQVDSILSKLYNTPRNLKIFIGEDGGSYELLRSKEGVIDTIHTYTRYQDTTFYESINILRLDLLGAGLLKNEDNP